MTAQVGAELLKLRTTKTAVALIGCALGFVILIAVPTALTADFETGEFAARDLLGLVAGPSTLVAFVLGILAVTTEIRHGTVTPTLIAAPDRLRVMLAKLAAHGLAGLLLGAICIGAGTAIALLGLSARDIETGLDSGDVAKIVLGQVLANGLWAALGVGFGALIGNQVGALVAGLSWTFLLEGLLGLLPEVGDAIQKYGPGGASSALGGIETENTGDLLTQLPGGLLFLAYAVAFVIAGTIMLRRRDITS
jgi:ABC-2 type transport system permease protein